MWAVGVNPRLPRLAARGKEPILAAAAGVVAERGLEGARFADVARAAGTAISSLQYFFGSREDLLLLTIEYVAQEEVRTLDELAAAIQDPARRLDALIRSYLDMSDEQVHRKVWVEVGRAAMRGPALRDIFARRREVWLESFGSAIAGGLSSGRFTGIGASRDYALELMALVDGLDQARLLEEPPLSAERAYEIVQAAMHRLLQIVPPSAESA